MRDMSMWRDGGRVDRIHALMVDPHSLDTVRGELPDVILDGCSITEGYYTDHRVSGSLRVLDTGSWLDGSWVRIVHECPGYSYREELATLIPSKVARTERSGGTTLDLDLQSVLWSISKDTLASHFTIGQGAQTTDAFSRICQTVEKDGVVLAGSYSHRYASTVVYELGDTFLSDLFDVCATAGNRLSVDGHGRIVMGPYVEPSRREPDWVLDPRDPRTIVLDEGVGWSEEVGKVASRAVVIYKDGDTEISASSDVSPSSRYSAASRGYTVAAQHSVTEMSPATNWQAQRLADQYLAADSAGTAERTVKCMYFPVHQGDIVLWQDGGEATRCLAKDVDVDLGGMTVALTLKEV